MKIIKTISPDQNQKPLESYSKLEPEPQVLKQELDQTQNQIIEHKPEQEPEQILVLALVPVHPGVSFPFAFQFSFLVLTELLKVKIVFFVKNSLKDEGLTFSISTGSQKKCCIFLDSKTGFSFSILHLYSLTRFVVLKYFLMKEMLQNHITSNPSLSKLPISWKILKKILRFK